MKPITCLVAAIVALALAFVAPVHAQVDCADWNPAVFFEAAEVSDLMRCLQAGADLEARNETGYTPLQSAVMLEKAEAVTALTDVDADLQARDELGYTMLHLEAGIGNAKALTALLEAGANLEALYAGLTPLHLAAPVVTTGGRPVKVAPYHWLQLAES